MLQSCTIESGAVIGAGAVILEGAIVEANARVEDGAVVHAGRRIPAGQVWGGNPAVYIRDATPTEVASAEENAKEVSTLAAEHAHEFLPYTVAYQQAETLGLEKIDPYLAAIKKAHHAAMVEAGEEHPETKA